MTLFKFGNTLRVLGFKLSHALFFLVHERENRVHIALGIHDALELLLELFGCDIDSEERHRRFPKRIFQYSDALLLALGKFLDRRFVLGVSLAHVVAVKLDPPRAEVALVL